MITRRTILKVGALSMTGLTALTGKAAADNQSLSGEVLGAKVFLITPTNPLFFQKLSEYFPGLQQKAKLGQILKASVLIVNSGKEDLYGYDLAWRSASDVKIQKFSRQFLQRPSAQLKRNNRTMSRPILARGDVALVSPYFSWSSAEFSSRVKAGKFSDFSKSGTKMMRARAKYPDGKKFIKAMATNPEVKIVVRSLILKNRIIGHEAAKAQAAIQNRINAEHDEASKLLQSSINRFGVLDLNLLTTNIQKSVLISQQSAKFRLLPYVMARGKFAERVLHLKNTGVGEEQIRSVLHEVATTHPKIFV